MSCEVPPRLSEPRRREGETVGVTGRGGADGPIPPKLCVSPVISYLNAYACRSEIGFVINSGVTAAEMTGTPPPGLGIDWVPRLGVSVCACARALCACFPCKPH